MSVYMDELPNNCDCCPCNDDYYRCGLSGDLFDEHDIDIGRMKNCKLKRLADVRENVRGEWIDCGIHGDWAWEQDGHGNSWHIWKCSKCEYKTEHRSNYCPNCGAQMER